MRRLLATVVFLFLFSDRGLAEDATTPLRVFVCGHSFMIYTGNMLPPLAKAAGLLYADAGQQMLGDSRVIQHWMLPDGQNKAKAALVSGTVDVLTLSPNSLMPDPGIDNFVKLGYSKNRHLRVLIQASWPAYDGRDRSDPKINVPGAWDRDAATVESLREMRRAQNSTWRRGLEAQVLALNSAIGAKVATVIPVNDAVFALRERVIAGTAPGIAKQSELFTDPLGHPSPALSHLVTYCHYAAIFRRTPVGLPVPSGYENVPRVKELNTLLQELAWNAISEYDKVTPRR